jgi:O-antigen/teichoic acid export membrane protein
MIIATPVFINKLGIEQYGLWMLVNTITLAMNALNIGVGDSNIRLISRYRAEKNPGMIRKVFRHNFSLAVFLCLLAIVAGACFYFFDFISLFYKSADVEFAGRLLMLASAAAGIKFIELSIVSVFKAFERFDISSRLILLSKNSVMVLNLLLVVKGAGLQTIFVSTVVLSLVNVAFQLGVLSFFHRGLIALPGLHFFRQKLDYMNYNLWYWLQSVIALTGFLADKLVVAWFTDVKTLGYYSVASLIGSQIHNLFLAFGSFLFPRVSFKLASNNGVGPLYFAARSFIALPGWCLIALLLLFGDYIFKAWLGSETFYQAIEFIKLYLVFEAGMLLIITPYYFINGTSQLRLNSVFEIVIRCSHFLSILIGYHLGGVTGILYGLILTTFLNIPFQYFLFHKKVLQQAGDFQFVLVMLPVFCLLALLGTSNRYYQLPALLCLVLSAKFIYYDPAKQYARNIFAFRKIFSRLAAK